MKTDIIISGGGIAGLTLAALLGKSGLNVSLIEPFPPKPLAQTPTTARTVALMESSINVVRATGAWDKIAEFANPLKTMRLIDDSVIGAGRIETEFHAEDIGLKQFGHNIANGALRAALYETVQKISAIKIHSSTLAAYSVEKIGVAATLEDETEISAPLIVGADGKKSTVRDIANIDCRVKAYNQSAITCVIAHSRAHNDASSEFHRPSGPFALVPMRGNYSAVVWIEKTERADEILKFRKDDVLNLLKKNACGILGALTLESNPESWPLQCLKAEKLIAPRAALMAEAAHVMSPIAAQGLNLSLRDAAALAETIIDAARAGIDIGAQTTLKKYQRRRMTDINARVFGVDAMNGLVAAEFGFIKDMRRNGLKAFSQVPPLKKLAMRQGLAPDMDVGRLGNGLPL